jgi:hypothetical protein
MASRDFEENEVSYRCPKKQKALSSTLRALNLNAVA